MKAVVMAGGEGSRLRPLTLVRPKPMLPVVHRPVLGHILYLLKQHGITDVIITLQYLAGQIQDYFGDGTGFGMRIEYVVEETPLGTAGSVKNAESHFGGEPILVISGDALTDFDLTALVRHHRQRGAALTMALYRVPDPLEYGVINVGPDGRVRQFSEKPDWGGVTSDTINTGIYVVEPDVVARMPAGEHRDWGQDVFPHELAAGLPLYGYVAAGYWCDVGTLPEYRRANDDLLNGVLDLGSPGKRIGPGIWSAGPVDIAPDAQLFGPIYLGEEVKIKPGAVVQGPAVIRDYAILDSRSSIQNSIVWRNCYIGDGAMLHGAVLGRQCSVKARAMVFEGAVIGDGTVVGQDAIIQAGVRVWPHKNIENGAVVARSLIWGSQGRRVLFGRYGVTGVVNVDLTPDFAARLGAAFGSTLPKGSKVTINRDPNRSSRMIKRALISGLPSAGNHVLDLATLPIPVARYYTRASGVAGGVHVRLSPHDPRVVDIALFGGNGLSLTREQERAIERVFFREDFRHAYLEEIGNIEYVQDADDVYREGYFGAVDVAAIREAGFKIVVDYAHAPAADVLGDLLDRLDVEAVPLNARVDAGRIAPSPEDDRADRAQLSRIVRALDDVCLGARLDPGGERLFVVDDAGNDISEPIMCAVMASLALRSHPRSTVVVTIDQPLVHELLAARHGGFVRRCPADPHALTLAAAEKGVAMAGDGAGRFAFPSLHPAVDGLFALGKLLEMLAQYKLQLSEVVAELPPFHMASGRVEGMWDSKGRVMRCLIQQFSKLRHETTDGIKIYLSNAEWVLIRPDNDSSTFHLVAEAGSPGAAQEIIADYGGLVHRFVQESCVAEEPPAVAAAP